MERIIERYERYSNAEMHLNPTHNESHGNWSLEHAKLKCRIEQLQKTQRHFMGEDLDSLNLKELQSLEQQLDTALKNVRSKKNQVMLESISQLQKKDKDLQDQNNLLSKQIKEHEKEVARHELELQNHGIMPSFQLNNLNNCDSYTAGDDGEVEENPRQGQPSTVMPPWMVQYMNQ